MTEETYNIIGIFAAIILGIAMIVQAERSGGLNADQAIVLPIPLALCFFIWPLFAFAGFMSLAFWIHERYFQKDDDFNTQ